ncbi:cysteine methyltransferase [Brachybacterium ginsengisoli]|uniref:Methylated-DNA--protein-cysteine methyltransferase n=1 Tax=Brachybacterium ginsengisoli TaxID=1331682 RepID=A0A291GYZ1_9MICO|nr:methylated-DNA--[protein]-cysteine S-methyltransferase [Brachybacterium ginsengisoli]ATG55439.1 cysteine methyltransferase [Brachybacterium ginsengisoli]
MTPTTSSAQTPESSRTTGSGPRHRRVATPLGVYLIAAEGDALVGVWRLDQSHFPRPERLGSAVTGTDPLLDAAERQLLDYLDGAREGFDLPLDARGTDFQREVWAQLRTIPRGSTTTYGEIARALDRPRAAQAVGAAVGSNPLSIVVPCHRVLGSAGAMTGYAGGIETKQALLLLEGATLA